MHGGGNCILAGSEYVTPKSFPSEGLL
jgi:hypothetical protein